MRYRKLGKDGPEVSVLGVGLWPITGGLGKVDRKQGIATIRHALDRGITLVDGAQSYEGSEEILGEALKDGYRDKCFIATKVSWKYSKEDVERAIESSLTKLGVDYVDLYQVHGWWDHTYPIEETMTAMAKVREQGKARCIGVSNFNAAQMERTLGITTFNSNQVLYNMLGRGIEKEDIPFCEQNGISVIAYSAIAHGMLSGKFKPGQTFAEDDWRSRADRFKGETFAKVLEITGELEKVASDKGLAMPEMALGWVLRKEAVASLLTGAKRPEQIDEQLGAAEVTFTEEEEARIDAILAETPEF